MTSLKQNNSLDWVGFEFGQSKSTLEQHYSMDDAVQFYRKWKKLIFEAVCLVISKASAEDQPAQEFAAKWLNLIRSITEEGDPEILAAHQNVYENMEHWPEDDKQLMKTAEGFIDEAVVIFLSKHPD
jgi:hypothetical protein